MKQATKISHSLSAMAISAMATFSVLMTGTLTTESVSAQDTMQSQLYNVCNSGYAGTWIIGNSCDLGAATDLQTDDAMVVQCDSQTGAWSIDFYQEPADADPNDPVSQATRFPLCPGNGRLTSNADGDLVLRCNYWEAVDNVAKQLELQLQPSSEPNIRSISWQASELDNPNVICGVAGRPEGNTGVGSGGQTVD